MRRVRNGLVKGGTRENRPPPGVEKACLFLKKKSGERNVVCSEEGIHGSRKKGESCPLSQASMGTTDSTQICQGSCFFTEKVFPSVKSTVQSPGLDHLEVFRVSQRERSLEARLLVQIVNQAGKCSISPASSCHLEMSSRKEQPLYHRGYKRNRD